MSDTRMTEAQDTALRALCGRYGVTYRPDDYWPTFDLPAGYVAGWVGGNDGPRPLYIGCDKDGRISS
jgi:hypothetical protein